MTSPPEQRSGWALWESVRSVLQGASLDPPLRPGPAGPAPLSPVQALYWCPERPAENGTYLIPIVYRIPGEIDPASLARSLAEVARRHQVLRSQFAEIGGEAHVVVLPEAPVRLPLVDLSALPEAQRQTCGERLIAEEAVQTFRLDRGPLAAFKLLRLDGTRHVLLATFHHSIFDGWSLSLFARELSVLYEAFAAGRPSPLAEPRLQYGDYARWRREWLQGPSAERQRSHWRATLDGLPCWGIRAPLPAGPAVQHVQAVPPGLTRKLRELGDAAGTTLFMTLLAAFKALLHGCTGEKDLCLRTIVAGRTRRELCDLIGCFINEVPLRASLAGDPGCRELLDRVRESVLGAFTNADVPFHLLLEDLPARAPLQIQFLFQNFPAGRLRINGREIAPGESASGGTETPLMVTVNEDGDGLAITWQGHGVAFDAPRLAALAGGYAAVLEAMAADPDVRLSGLPEPEGDLVEILTFLLTVEES
jgi:condensation domain-containing protein